MTFMNSPRFWTFVLLALLGPMFSMPPLQAAETPPVNLPFAGQRVLFLGDSITQAGQYVTFIEYYLNRRYPTAKFDLISIGLSSETVSGLSEKAHPFPRPYLHERLWAALDTIKPSVVVACYGMNDGIYHPQSAERMAAFQTGIKKLIAEAKAAGAKIVLLTPPPFDPVPVHNAVLPASAPDYSYIHPFADYDSVLADYARWEMSLPATDAQVIDIHTPLSNYLAAQRKTDPTFHFSGDGIHPSPAGHLLMALTILRGLGLALPANDLNQEFARVTADPMYSLVERHRQTRSEGWLPYVGYTRDSVVKTPSIEKTEQEATALQVQIDRLRATR